MTSPLRILFYEDPITDYNSFMWRIGHVRHDGIMLRALRDQGWEGCMLLNRRFVDVAADNGITSRELIPVDEDAWIRLLDDPQDNVNTLLYTQFDGEGRLTGPENSERRAIASRVHARLEQAVAAALGDFKPDVVVARAPIPFLRTLFPEALILSNDVGMMTRMPYPFTHHYDPCGMHAQAWPARFPETVSHDPKAWAQIDRLRDYFAPIFDVIEPFPYLAKELKAFRKTILVAGQVNGHFSYDGTCGYRSQTHMLLDVLEHTPSDCAVILGQHPNAQKLIRAEEMEWLHGRSRISSIIRISSAKIRSRSICCATSTPSPRSAPASGCKRSFGANPFLPWGAI